MIKQNIWYRLFFEPTEIRCLNLYVKERFTCKMKK
jgi:hypothetical protein